MSPYLEMIQAISRRYDEKIRKACTPLFEFLNLNYFWYHKVTYTGYLTCFGSNLAWCEYFDDQNFHLSYPYFKSPKYFQNSTSLLVESQNQSVAEMLSAARNSFNMRLSLILLNKNSEGLEVFGFSSKSADEMQISMLLTELPSIRLFAKKFRQDNQSLFAHLEDVQIDFAKLIGPAFYEKPMVLTTQPAKRRTFLQEMGAENSLSEGESDVIGLLLQGHSASQIGEKLFRSKRTIEHRIEKIKEKLGCFSRVELIQKARELERIGCLSEM